MYKNKWNGNLYEVVSKEGDHITLKRQDKSVFTIAKSEFNFSYKIVK